MAIYTKEEQDLLNQSMQYRKDMITEIFKDGTPTHTGTVRVVNELLNSIDTQIHNNANTRLKETEINDGKDIQQMIIGLLKEQNKKMLNTPKRESLEYVEVDTNDIIETPNFVPGEDGAYEELSAEDFISKGE